ncbi:F-box/kelch-repeat protein At3g23880 isoform X1 [Lactuca sativa]|uniref:F-box/kelch-repeat protein At3g23880 isoform X1 n=1 Tax=Lactuca sativa TaxID=4236 RepID=UPI000CA761A2|nr:F-box/kelch-repeat protein At3g23880 isoform X1 [Lactuca sativa]
MEIAIEDEEDEQQQQPKRIKASHSTETSEDPLWIPTLLPEIIIEILSRLPVESLLRCKSVCKLWCSMISDSHFVKSHLALSTSNNRYTHHRLILHTSPRINLKSSPLYDVLYAESVNLLEHDYPLKHPYKSIWIAGSCNGLLFIAVEDDDLFLWNPGTRKSNRLPDVGFNVRSGSYVLYGFGYDESKDDYKVVGISCVFRSGGNYNIRVKIYSMKLGNWKNIGAFPHGIPLDDSGKLSNGALHWAASQDFGSFYSWRIISLDLAKETYGEILQPVYDEGNKDLTLGALGESLCVLCDYSKIRADVWVMKVYGVKDSWTKLVSIPYLTDPGRDQFSVPLCISNDGKVLLQFGAKLVLYDSKNLSFSEIHNIDECHEAYTFVESLVSPEAPIRSWR